MNNWKDSPTANVPKTSWQIRAEAERERRRRRIESMSLRVTDRDINMARFNRWWTTKYGQDSTDRNEGSDYDFLRSEIERFEAYTLSQIRALGLDKLSDEELEEEYLRLVESNSAGNENGGSEPHNT